MIQNIIWVISFISLYIAIVWLNFLYINVFEKKEYNKEYPSLTVAIPAYNEEKTILKTINSALEANYPMEKLKIIVVNDGSSDNTLSVVKEFLSKQDLPILLLDQDNSGKASAMNNALSHCDTELFACLDADSSIDQDSIKHMIPHFEKENIAAVISAIKVNNPSTLYEKVQRIEYTLAVLSRKLRASIKTLAMTPGVLSMYKSKVLKEVGGFDEGNITEDFEIALRLKSHGYDIAVESDSFTYTNCPKTFKSLWNQRIRWFRGYLFNNLKYRKMFFSSDKKINSFFKYFQLPLNIIGIPLLLTTTLIISYNLIKAAYEQIIRISLIDGYLKSLFYIPSIKSFILTYNFKLMFPLFIASVAGIYMFYVAHKQVKERIKYPVSILAYFLILPYLSSLYWITALSKELFRTKRKW